MNCAKVNCQLEFNCMFPVLLIWAKGIPKSAGKPIEMVIGIPVCGRCQRTARAKDYMTDEGWSDLCARLKIIGKAEPDRDTMGLRWVRPFNIKEKFKRPT